MAGSVNKVMLIGNLGRDPEIKEGNNGNFVTFSIATNYWSKKDEAEVPEWHNIVCYNENIVKFISTYIKKGNKVYVEGKLNTRSWEKDGIKRYATDIIANRIESLSSKSESNQEESNDDMPFPGDSGWQNS